MKKIKIISSLKLPNSSLVEKTKKYLLLFLCACLLITALNGCTRNPDSKQDPYESFNRKVFTFNNTLDKYITRPIAVIYTKVTPNIAQRGVNNFFGNLDTLGSIPNDILQGKATFAVADFWRLLVNTTIGIGGLFDVATKLGIPPHHEDFGLTLATWGAKKSAYFNIPFLGPSTDRDAFGKVVDFTAFSPWWYVHPRWISYALYGLDVVQARATLLPADKLMHDSFDPYIFLRDAYLQNREKEIADNKLDYDEFKAQAMANEGMPLDENGKIVDEDEDENGGSSASSSHHFKNEKIAAPMQIDGLDDENKEDKDAKKAQEKKDEEKKAEEEKKKSEDKNKTEEEKKAEDKKPGDKNKTEDNKKSAA